MPLSLQLGYNLWRGQVSEGATEVWMGSTRNPWVSGEGGSQATMHSAGTKGRCWAGGTGLLAFIVGTESRVADSSFRFSNAEDR